MNAAANDYNPWDFGLPAKAWECMRRNAEFSEAIEWKLNTGCGLATASPPACTSRPLFQRVWGVADKANCTREFSNLSWIQLPELIRTTFCDVFEKELRGEVVPVERPPWSAMAVPSINSTTAELRDWIEKNKPLWEKGLVVSLPTKIVDTEHVRSVRQFLHQQLRPAFRGSGLGKKGSVFGAKMEWHDYLLVEEFRVSKRLALVPSVALAALRATNTRMLREARCATSPAIIAELAKSSPRTKRNDVRTNRKAMIRKINNFWTVVDSLL